MIAALILALLAPLQELEPRQQAPEGPVYVSVSELSVQVYRPQHVRVEELYHLGQQMLGRNLCIRERGSPANLVANIQLLGDALVLYDTKDSLQRLVPMLQSLDQEVKPPSSDGAGAVTQTWEYTPRYLSIETTYEVLQPLRRLVFQPEVRTTTVSTGAATQTSNITVSEERRLVIVRDTPDRIQEIRELLQRVDVPQDQVTLTCWLLQGGAVPAGRDGAGTLEDVFERRAAEDHASQLPPDLVEHLQRLVPGETFERVGFALLQTAVSTRAPVSMQLTNMFGGDSWFLELRPSAFDHEVGTLSVDGCTLSHGGGAAQQRVFSTSLVLRGGEFTVVGASGEAPILVAIRVTPVGR